MKIAFHGETASAFRQGFESLVGPEHEIVDLTDGLDLPGEVAHFESADVLVGIKLNQTMPELKKLRLYQAPSAGTDAIDQACLPKGSVLCNCHGHENAIAEYVMTALLLRHVPLARADADLRQGKWTYWAGRPATVRTELGQQTIGLLGYGHIAQAVAQRAKAFGMRVCVANRSPVASDIVDQSFGLEDLKAFMGSVDVVVVCLPLASNTAGIVDKAALGAMRPGAVLINVGRGPVVDEQALFDALSNRRIGGAVIDTWYQYPTADRAECAPSTLDFAGLDNVTLTPHMSGWTTGTVARRQQAIADNIGRLVRGEPLANVLKAAGIQGL